MTRPWLYGMWACGAFPAKCLSVSASTIPDEGGQGLPANLAKAVEQVSCGKHATLAIFCGYSRRARGERRAT
jgi:hypothetical protein